MKSPFKFLDSYTKNDRDIFFGREKEIEELYRRVFDSRIMVVYGMSGTGKSSLIHCGLASKFRDSDWLNVNVRRGENLIKSMAEAVEKASLKKVESDQKGSDDLADTETSVIKRGYFRKAVRNLYLDHYKPIYFIFDQFEELFIFGTREETESFLTIIQSLLSTDLQCKFIFILREEYLGWLSTFENSIAGFFDNRMRIEKMDIGNARSAIEGPCKVHNISIEEGFAENMLQKLCPSNESEIELTYLQVYLDKIFKLASEGIEDERKITFRNSDLDKAGNVYNILGSFLDEQINHLPDPETAITVLKAFVSARGTKKSVNTEEIKEYALTTGKNIDEKTIDDLILSLVNLRILQDKDHAGRNELKHDALAAKIFEKVTLVEKELIEIKQFIETAYENWRKRGVLLSDKDLSYIAPYEDKLYLSEDLKYFITKSKWEFLRVKHRRRNIFITSGIALLIVFACFTVWALIERSQSQKQEAIAKSNYLHATSFDMIERDPTIALRLAESAYNLEQSEENYQSLVDIYSNNEFYGLFCSTNLEDLYYGQVFELAGKNGEVAVAGEGKIQFLDSKGRLLYEWNTDTKFDDFHLSPDQNYILLHGIDDTIRLYDSVHNLILKKCSHDANNQTNYGGSGFLPDSKCFFVGSYSDICIYSVKGDIIAETKPFQNDRTNYYWVPSAFNNHIYYFTFLDNSFYCWDIYNNTEEEVKLNFPEKHDYYYQGSILANDKIAFFTQIDNKIYIFDNQGIKITSWSAGENDFIHRFVRIDDHYFITLNDNSVKIWDYKGNNLKTLFIRNASSTFNNICYDSLTKRVLLSNDKNILFWNLGSPGGELIFRNDGSIYYQNNHIIKETDSGYEVFSPTGSSLWTMNIPNKNNTFWWPSKSLKLTACSDFFKTTADIFDTAGKKVCTIDLVNQAVSSLFFSSDDQLMGTIPLAHPNYLTLWDISGKEIRSMAGQGSGYYNGRFSEDNKYILLSSLDNLLTLWDTSGNQISQFWHPAWINDADISTDGNFIITGCQDGSARLWNSDGKLIDMFRSPEKETTISVKFSPSGSFFIMTDGKNLRLIDLKGNLIQAIAYDWSASGVFFHDNEKELLLGNREGIRKVTLKEPLNTFLKSKDLYDLSTKEKLSYNITSFNDAFKLTKPDELYDAGDYFLTSALQLRDPDMRQKLFNNAERLLTKGSQIDSLPARFYLNLTDLYFKNSLYSDKKYPDEIDDMFKKIYKSENFSELMDAALYYYNNINSMTFSYNFHENAILITDKLIRLYPSIGKYIIRDWVEFPFSLLKWQENKAALDLCILSKECFPENVYVNTYLPLCYLMNDSLDKAKNLYLEWKNKDLPSDLWSEREPKYRDWYKSDLRTLTNVGIKVKHMDEINALLSDTAK